MSGARLAPGATLAADLGGTKIAVARVSASGRVSGYATAPTPAGGRAVVERLAEAAAADPTLSSVDLAELVQAEFGLGVHPRSVERALARRPKDHGGPNL